MSAPALVVAILVASHLTWVTAAAAQLAPLGPEFVVPTYTTSFQGFPAVAADGAGNFVVVWNSEGDSDLGSVAARRYDASGTPLGGEFQVNTYTTGFQGYPAVAKTPGGDFVVVWTSIGSSGTDTDQNSIQGRRYDAAGTPQGSQFQVNTYTTGFQELPAVSMDGSGGIVVVWHSSGSAGTDASSTSIQGQRYDSMGAPQGAEFQVNTYTTALQVVPSVTSDPAGNFVVVWYSDGSAGTDTDQSSIQGQRYDSTGAPQGGEFQVNTYTTGEQLDPRVATDPLGNFVVVWWMYSYEGIRGQRYNSTGAAQGGEFLVQSYTSEAGRHPAASVDGAGNFVVVWDSYGSTGSDVGSISVQARLYDSGGTPEGPQFQVNTYTPFDQYHPAVTTDGAGNFVVAWGSEYAPGGDDDSVLAQRLGLIDAPISGSKIVIKDNADPAKRKILFRSRDVGLDTSPSAGIDPAINGAHIQVFNNNGSGDSACMPLPASGWEESGDANSPTFTYRDFSYANGPCRFAMVRDNKLLKAVCKASTQPITYSLDEANQVSVGVTFTSGTTAYCAVFEGASLKHDVQSSKFVATNATAPASCPTPPSGCP